MSVSFAPELSDEIREAADRESITVSAWLADAARAKLRHEGLKEAIRDWEAHFGPISKEAKARAREIFRQADALQQEGGGVLIVDIGKTEEDE